jgi:phosphoglycerate dehydrogenase-like enzyme
MLSRGLVEEQALLSALQNGQPAGAGKDAREQECEEKISPLTDLDNAILTPRIEAGTVHASREIGTTNMEMNQIKLDSSISY